MVEFAPSTGGLALWVRHEDVVAGGAAVPGAGHAATPVAAHAPIHTDGYTIRYEAAFEHLPLARQVGLVAHEVLHIALRHPQRYLELAERIGAVDLGLFNLCADAIVNSTLSHLSWLQLSPNAVHLEHLLALTMSRGEPVEKSLLEWDVERLYQALSVEPDKTKDGSRASRLRALGSAADADLRPSPGDRCAPELEAGQAREWSERIVRAHAGDGEFSMLRALVADLPRTRTPWEQVLRTLLARGLSPKRSVSWSRPTRSYIANQGRMGDHKRLPWEPGFSGNSPTPRLVVIVDVSGSIDDALMQRFAREIAAITRRLEASLVLVIGDDRVRHVGVFAPGRSDLSGIEFHGGGGTDFTPLLEEAARHAPDIALVLTDLQGPARSRPRFPVIWAVPEAYAAALQPFGRKLVLS
jgi:predicted metal-dependent peptidase